MDSSSILLYLRKQADERPYENIGSKLIDSLDTDIKTRAEKQQQALNQGQSTFLGALGNKLLGSVTDPVTSGYRDRVKALQKFKYEGSGIPIPFSFPVEQLPERWRQYKDTREQRTGMQSALKAFMAGRPVRDIYAKGEQARIAAGGRPRFEQGMPERDRSLPSLYGYPNTYSGLAENMAWRHPRTQQVPTLPGTNLSTWGGFASQMLTGKDWVNPETYNPHMRNQASGSQNPYAISQAVQRKYAPLMVRSS